MLRFLITLTLGERFLLAQISEKLKKYKEQAFLSKSLVQLAEYIPIDFDF
jgi:hypothetical protein